MKVKVSELRDKIDHLTRIVSVDFHACVSNMEKQRCLSMAQKVGTELMAMQCPTAKEEDLINKENALDLSTARLLGNWELINHG
jgi:hypothetical protein